MKRDKINYIVDVLMLFAFLISAGTGVMKYFLMPIGSRIPTWSRFFGITKLQWSKIHDYSGFALLLLIAIHFILHWSWMVKMTKRLFRK